MTPLQLFEKVSNIKLPGPEESAITMIDEYEKHQELWRENRQNVGDHFEQLWLEIQADEKQQKQSCKIETGDSDEDNANLEGEMDQKLGASCEIKDVKKKSNIKVVGAEECGMTDSNEVVKNKNLLAKSNEVKLESKTVTFECPQDGVPTEEFPSLNIPLNKGNCKQPRKSKKKKK
ncbi:uncharacterized protein LOC135222056 [Macrobrachium nipponense]|uniref:uncharacterized protein LOC135222056 n=1 Tax=Macrobrachium nipponense TaxID=159736 RepID=UPI0030C86790